MSPEQFAMLMHLGTLAFAISAGYVGLDKIHHDSKDQFRDALEAKCKTVKEYVISLDLENAEWETQKLYLIHPAFVLARVAQLRLNLPLYERTVHCVRRQPKLPLLNFIRFRRDVTFMAVLCIANLVALISIAWAGMWPQHAALFIKHPYAVPLAAFALSLLFRGFYAGLDDRNTAKWIWFVACAFWLLTTVLAVAIPSWASVAVDGLAEHFTKCVFLLFSGTLIWTLIVVACSYRLGAADGVFKSYRDRMEKHINRLNDRRVGNAEAALGEMK